MGREELAVLFRAEAIKARTMDELIGLCRGVVADGEVNQKEAEFVLNWLESNTSVAEEFPANVLYPRLMEMLVDGHLDEDESKELLDLLQQMTGEQGQCVSTPLSTCIAFDSPLPRLTFQGQAFCFTGKFGCGQRTDVIERTELLGGAIVSNVVKRGCVLVVGCMGSPAWLHSTHGRKILKAVDDRDAGAPIAIVPEEHWHHEAERLEQQFQNDAEHMASVRTATRFAMRRILREV